MAGTAESLLERDPTKSVEALDWDVGLRELTVATAFTYERSDDGVNETSLKNHPMSSLLGAGAIAKAGIDIDTNVGAYVWADQIPQLAKAREQGRADASRLLEERRKEHRVSKEAPLPPVDPLSTAEAVLAAEAKYGRESHERRERLKALQLDCDRMLAEWVDKYESGYYPPVRHVHDKKTDDHFAHGMSIRSMHKNAIQPIGGTEETLRINDFVGDITARVAHSIGSATVRTIMQCPDGAIAAYEEDRRLGIDRKEGYGGYVPSIAKLVICDVSKDPITDDRLVETASLPGEYVTPEIINEALARRSAQAEGMNKTELHGSQLLVSDRLMDFAALLDQVASEEWCVNIFMGKVVPEGYVKDYDAFCREAVRRQEGLHGQAKIVRDYILELAQEKTDKMKALVMVDEFVKCLLLSVAKEDRSGVLAARMFDANTGKRLIEAKRLEDLGRQNEADAVMLEATANAQGGGSCGPGMCGLEGVDRQSKEGAELAGKVQARAGDIIVKDKERACKCGKKTIVYAFSSTKVNKLCTSCGAFESKITRGGSSK